MVLETRNVCKFEGILVYIHSKLMPARTRVAHIELVSNILKDARLDYSFGNSKDGAHYSKAQSI